LQFILLTVPPMEVSAKVLYVRRDSSLRIMIYIFEFSLKSYRDLERLEVKPQSQPEKPSNIYLGRQSYTQIHSITYFYIQMRFYVQCSKIRIQAVTVVI